MPMYFFFGGVKKLQAYGEKCDPIHEVKKVGSEYRGMKIQATEYEVLTVILEFEQGMMVTLELNSNVLLASSKIILASILICWLYCKDLSIADFLIELLK